MQNKPEVYKNFVFGFADSLFLSLGLSPDLAVDVEACVAPGENLLHKGKADELFPEKQREDLMGENLIKV